MERSKGVRIYGVLLIAFGIYNLLGVGAYKQFSVLFKTIPQAVTVAMYVFTILYGISAAYCGNRILHLENWARKLIVGMTSISVITGFLLNKTVLSNFKEYIMTEQAKVPPEMAGSVYTYAVFMTAAITIFELSVIYFFTRPSVVEQFHQP
ncbi:MAG: hypothetical protein GF409_05345 [Candidatus Omnitrophica bacterium]|nr:hypothetical protein [Candidatus Omnitrophota bacterium]